LTTHCGINLFKLLQVQSRTIFLLLFKLWSMWGVSWYDTQGQIGMANDHCVILRTSKVSLSLLWISWIILHYCGLSKIIVAHHWGDIIKQTSIFTMFEMFRYFSPYFQKEFPTTIWVKWYLGGTIKNHPP